MSKAKKIFLYLILTFCSVVLVFLIALAIGTFIARVPAENTFARPSEGQVVIFVLNNGVHTDIAVPVRNEFVDWTKDIDLETVVPTRSIDTTFWLAFGWGEKNFFINVPTWKEFSFELAIASLLFEESLMHISAFSRLRESPHSKRLLLSSQSYLALANYIRASFQRDENGRPIRIANGYSAWDAFFAANGSYSPFNTCNTWTARGLHKAGFATPLWPALAYGVMWHL